ncbi:hypothetical protein [Neomegalonema perideroedes]|uniref:hypothetical protein n=1 Tax=Neomegalonema perideroedes TaxID=217219 RepID=UPI0003738774|nr:hypothetical protein [Neomegalonema perideroedes]
MNALNPLHGFTPQIIEGDCDEPPTFSLPWLFGRKVPYQAALLPVSRGGGLDWIEHLVSCRYKQECFSCPLRRKT